MANVYEEVKLEDMEYSEEEQTYWYQCPCGDMFTITVEELMRGEDIAPCNSCSLQIKVLYEKQAFATHGQPAQIMVTA
eukprot:CAMPEP_0174297152 /NCGR_PEP_ID=MMETSP0809-20121228/50184_1 /TAXON_ID=73025 ORGANISM="Eutreptiella gymnastica-like, Strain CCMP1594" /NCGR_SAMPLE_ID=MMETSP0809 /ASSEMBLY_ACC=CAM_ASM_000658 /LENGTH=77 /DNA_ID=CAMNT_0015400735 /DNA_START=20 /DNA_END=253 /DNA_ORIENTATION=-